MQKITKDQITKEWKWLFPIIHFLASFFYERSILLFSLDKDIVLSIPRDDSISTALERGISYGISKLIALCLIVLFWRTIFFVIENWKKSRTIRIATCLYLVGLLLCLCLFPTYFMHSSDNYITYSYAIRLLPEYWHNCYSGFVYCAILMFFPHPVAIAYVQWSMFAFAMGYLAYRMEKSTVIAGSGKWFLWLLPLIPGISVLLGDGYRTEQYAILSMMYLAVVMMDVVEQKKRPMLQLAGLALFSAFMGTWRTEGVIFASLFFVTLLCYVYRFPWKKLLLWTACYCLLFLVVSYPQKMGNVKYYGRDYSLVNSFEIIQNILNTPEANLSYDGAEEDLEALARVTPLDAIRLYGLDGYRRYNVMSGRADINQSLAQDEASKDFMGAYYRILLHNLPIYLKTQVTNVTTIWGITSGAYNMPANIPDLGEYPEWNYAGWDIGNKDYSNAPYVFEWANLYLRQIVMLGFDKICQVLGNVRDFLRLNLLMFLGLPFLEGCIVLREFVLAVRYKSKKSEGNLGLGAMALALLGLFGGIVMVMPAGFLVYFHAYYYMSFLLVGIYLILFFNNNGRKKREGKR